MYSTKTPDQVNSFNTRVSVSVVMAVLLALATLFPSCSTQKRGCKATENMSGYGYTKPLKQALIGEYKMYYDTTVADLSVKAIPGYTYIGTSNVVYLNERRKIKEKATGFFVLNRALPKCGVWWCNNISVYSYLDGMPCCCNAHSEGD